MGLENVHVDEHAIVTAVLPATMRGVPRIGFVAHLDTVDVALSPEVHPRIQRFDGGDVCLNPERDIWLRVAEHPELLPYKGQEIIFTDGTSVLGADNKAAIANIMTMLEIMTSERPAHGEIRVAFVPDEEIGLWGSKLLDLERFDVDFAYTIDCCAVGELVYETFNAGSVIFEIDGVTAHPMSAKNVLVNPLLVAADIMAGFDRAQTPSIPRARRATGGSSEWNPIPLMPPCVCISATLTGNAMKLARHMWEKWWSTFVRATRGED